MATIGTLAGLAWFTAIQRRAARTGPPDDSAPAGETAGPADEAAGPADEAAGPDEAEAGEATDGADAQADGESGQDRNGTAVQSSPAAE